MYSILRRPRFIKTVGRAYIQNLYKKELQLTERNEVARYGGRYLVTGLTGIKLDEVFFEYMQKVFRKCGVPVDFEHISIPDATNEDDISLAINSILRNRVCLMGNLQTAKDVSNVWIKNILRKELDLSVAVMNCKNYPGVPAKFHDLDVLVVRQNIEGEYTMLEHEPVKGVIQHISVITEHEAMNSARFAFEFAKIHKRKKITNVHLLVNKPLSDGIFLKCSEIVAKDYPDIVHDNISITSCCKKIVSNPKQFDVLLSTHLYGSILALCLCGLTSGVGLYPFSNYGDKLAVFEPGFSYTVKQDDKDCPIAYLNAGVQMLRYLKLTRHSSVIQKAINDTINEAPAADICGVISTEKIIEGVLNHLPNVFD